VYFADSFLFDDAPVLLSRPTDHKLGGDWERIRFGGRARDRKYRTAQGLD